MTTLVSSEPVASPTGAAPELSPSNVEPANATEQPTRHEVERARLVQALHTANGNERVAAKALGMTVTALKRKLRRHRLTPYLVQLYAPLPLLTWGMLVAREPKLQVLLH